MNAPRKFFAGFFACLALIGWVGVAEAVLKGAGFNGTYAGTGVFDAITLDSTNQDVKLVRDAANILAQRNSTTAQTLRVYNTFTDASNYERGVLDWGTSANSLTIGSQNAGTGQARTVIFVRGGTQYLSLTGTPTVTVSVPLLVSTAATANQVRTAQTTPPTCSTNCGTSPSIVGTDTAGTVTMGSSGSPASGWVVTFNGTWASAPACVVQMGLAGMVVGKMPLTIATTTTTITVVTNGTAPSTSDKYHFHCIGVS